MPRHSSRRARRELGQNLLTDSAIAQSITIDALDRHPDYLVVEFGPGRGALTTHVLARQRAVVAIERDPQMAASLPNHPLLDVVVGDAQRARMPSEPFIVLGNLPFRGGTAILRSLLHHCERGLAGASLLFEEAFTRKRAGDFGSNLFNAQWAPWVTFHAGTQVPPHAFSPRPRVRVRVLHVHPRARPLVSPADRKGYQAMVRRIFEGRGNTVRDVLRADPEVPARGPLPPVHAGARAKDLTAKDWRRLWRWLPGH